MVGEPVLPGLAKVDHTPAVARVEEVRRPTLVRGWDGLYLHC